jgi:hypothetical protein
MKVPRIAHDVAYFVGGLFLANAVPHFVSGVCGQAFQSPFATPPGEGLSSSMVNVAWGFTNLVVAYVLLAQVGTFTLRRVRDAVPFGLGMLGMALMLASWFGKLHGGVR